MINAIEAAERKYLEEVMKKLHQASKELEEKLTSSYREIIDAKKYLWVNLAELDPAERAANRMDISMSIDSGEQAAARHRKIRKLIESAYFGRVDFHGKDHDRAEIFYIGVHSFSEDGSRNLLIYDWRSPIASLFYDFNAGPAYYDAPMGRVEGDIRTKRQYKIRDGLMDYMIESSMNIHDDVLQKELSSTSDEKMKNIVATIQKEQNAIIRNETSNELIIQGVAGSGKTSVALHRVAYLLYRHKDTLKSRNVLILSPNKAFSDYISNVLPELGEEKIMEVNAEELAAKELAGICGFQTFHEQVRELAEVVDPGNIERIRFKAGVDFVEAMDSYMKHVDGHYFVPEDIRVDGIRIPKDDVLGAYRASIRLPVKHRLEKAALSLIGSFRTDDGERLTPASSRTIKAAIRKMFKFQNVMGLYKDFYAHIGKPRLFKLYRKNTIEYADVYPLIYLKMFYLGPSVYESVKHLLIDEMQDYTPIQYAVLSKWFPCKKTILGDSSQSVNPYSSTTLQEIKRMFPEAETIELLKSYRSTLEIMTFAKALNPGSRLVPVERHGEQPQLIECTDVQEEWNQIRELCLEFSQSDHHSLGIVCKTRKQAETVYQGIQDVQAPVCLLDFHSEQFHEGITVTFSHMAKGLEFDRVIIPFANADNYSTDLDKSLLYIACTRAMHSLYLTWTGERAAFLRK